MNRSASISAAKRRPKARKTDSRLLPSGTSRASFGDIEERRSALLRVGWPPLLLLLLPLPPLWRGFARTRPQHEYRLPLVRSARAGKKVPAAARNGRLGRHQERAPSCTALVVTGRGLAVLASAAAARKEKKLAAEAAVVEVCVGNDARVGYVERFALPVVVMEGDRVAYGSFVPRRAHHF